MKSLRFLAIFVGSLAIAACSSSSNNNDDALGNPIPATGVKVARSDGGTDLVIVRFDPQTDGKPAGESTFPGGKTDALVTVIRLDANGAVARLDMIGGTKATIAMSTSSDLSRISRHVRKLSVSALAPSDAAARVG